MRGKIKIMWRIPQRVPSRLRAFTLIELLVVIAIIGLLSSIVFASLNSARAKARDARRQADLRTIATALQLWFDNNGNWIEGGSGCGYQGNGSGWFNYEGTNYPKSIARCLQEAGYTSAIVQDPTGGKTSSPSSGYTYMKYTCTLAGKRRTFLYAKLENRPQSSTATDGTCCSTCDTSYGMNYVLAVE